MFFYWTIYLYKRANVLVLHARESKRVTHTLRKAYRVRRFDSSYTGIHIREQSTPALHHSHYCENGARNTTRDFTQTTRTASVHWYPPQSGPSTPLHTSRRVSQSQKRPPPSPRLISRETPQQQFRSRKLIWYAYTQHTHCVMHLLWCVCVCDQ